MVSQAEGQCQVHDSHAAVIGLALPSGALGLTFLSPAAEEVVWHECEACCSQKHPYSGRAYPTHTLADVT